MIHYPNFDDLNKFKLSLLHGETSEIGNKCFVGCYAPWLKGGIYAVTNIDVEILNVIQIFILAKATFFLEGIQRSSLITKKSDKQIQTGILIKLTKNSVIIATSLWTRYYIKKFVCERSQWHNTSPLLLAHVHILMDTNERNNRMPPIRCGSRTEPCEVSCCLIVLPTRNSHRLKQK